MKKVAVFGNLRITRPFTNILTRTQNFSFAKSSPLATL
jgi:hypothetical protein